MGKINVTRCEIEGLCVIEPKVFFDERGYFVETYNENDFKAEGFDVRFVQDNQSMSVRGVLRGLHFQKEHPQGKLVRCLKGRVYDVAVDLRASSPTFGKWFGVELTAENKKQFFVPEGFAHGFLVLSDEAEFAYKCTDFYHPGDEGGLYWNDPQIGIEWPIEEGMELIISEKDQKWGGLTETFRFE
jgi:dTDP-4-dehydrorhamnose 3,5-epimerase